MTSVSSKDTPRGRGRPPGKKQTPNLPSTSTTQVPTENRYEQLNHDEDLSETDELTEVVSQTSKRRKISNGQSDNQAQPRKSPKPPPHNIEGQTYLKIKEIFDSAGIPTTSYRTKFTEKGTRVFAENDEVYKQIDAKLRDAKAKFFTHLPRDQQTTKIVLHGLYKMPETELKEKLGKLGFQPSKVTIMTIKKQKHSDHCVYLLHFPKSLKVKITNLRENIKAIDQVIVRWEYYKNKRNGPIQCSNCMQFGHGKQSCFLDPMCVRCGGKHASKECNLLKDPETQQIRDRVNDEELKCGLCGQNHAATYRKCTKRQEFIERQNTYRKKTQRKNGKSNYHQQERHQSFVPAPQLDDFHFPLLQNASQQSVNPQAHWAQPSQQNNQDFGSGDLFSGDQVAIIVADLMDKMSQAKTKQDQIIAIAAIVTKYCFNGFSR